MALDANLGAELVIQNDVSNRLSDITILAPITSTVRFPLNPVHVLLADDRTGPSVTSVALLNPMASFTNHYNEKMNKCFVLIQNTDTAKPDDGTLFLTKTLFDAFEGTSYGEYMWRSDKSKKYWEVAPLHCMVTLLSGAEKVCHSSDEFDAMVKLYMQ